MPRSRVRTRTENYKVTNCPHCQKTHTYEIEILYEQKALNREGDKVILFGGPRKSEKNYIEKLSFLCPISHKKFTKEVKIVEGKDEKILNVGLGVSADITSQTTAENNLAAKELEEWIISSTENVRDYCKTMLTAATSAIPIIFIVLKYLGQEVAANSQIALIGIIPAIFFLMSSIIFIFALRPRYFVFREVDDFISNKESYFRILNSLIIAGTIFFFLSVVLSIASFALVLFA